MSIKNLTFKAMIIDTDRLVKQSTYAKMKGFSRQRIGQLIEQGKIECVKIDGTPFIIIEKKDKK